MLGRSFFAGMDNNDPFFEGHQEHMRNMDRMFQDPFGMFGGHPMLLGPARQTQQRPMPVSQGNNMAMSPFGSFGGGMFGNMFMGMNSMMANMERTFENASNDPNAHVYSQSSVYSYTNTGGEGSRPRVYQATSSVRQAPGGVKESRKSVRDSEKGEKMAIGHQINDRAHIIQKTRRRDGDVEEDEELINMDEHEKERFDREFQEKTRESMRGLEYRRRGERSDRRALPAPRALPDPADRRGYRDRERRERN